MGLPVKYAARIDSRTIYRSDCIMGPKGSHDDAAWMRDSYILPIKLAFGMAVIVLFACITQLYL